MTNKEILAKIQFDIVEKIAFCPIPPQHYKEICDMFQQMSSYINENFKPNDQHVETILFKELSKELERALNKIVEYQCANLKLQTLLEAKNKEIEELNDLVVKAKAEIFKSKVTSAEPVDKQESFNNAIEERVAKLEKIFSNLTPEKVEAMIPNKIYYRGLFK